MKRRILFLSISIIFALFAGCTKDKTELLEINEEYFDFLGVADDGGSFFVTSNTQWTVSSSESWIKFSPESGEGSKGVVVSVDYNTTPNIRTGSVKLSTPGGITRTVLVAQLGTTPGIIARAVGSPLSGKNTLRVRITATHEWEAVIPSEAQSWLRWGYTLPQNNVDFTYLIFDWNETGAARTADVVFRLKNGGAQTLVSVTQPFIVPPAEIDYQEEAVKASAFTIKGKNLGSVEKVFLNDVEVTITEKTDTYVTVYVPALPDGTYQLKIIYGSKEMVLGPVDVIPAFPKVTEMPAKAEIGTSFILHGTQFNTVSKVFLGTTEVQFARGRTPERTMLVTVPSTAKTGEVDLKFIYTGSLETSPGTVELVNHTNDPTKDLARYAGSKYPDVPRVVEPGRTNGFNASGGRSVLFAFDGAIDNTTYAKVDYDTYYVGQMNWDGTKFGTTTVGGKPNAGRTYWQVNSGQNEGEIDDGAATPSNRTCFYLDFSTTPTGYATFDRIELIGRGNNADAIISFTVEISDNCTHWIKVVKEEDSKQFDGTTRYTYPLPNPVTAKYVRFVALKAVAHNTGLSLFELYCTK